MELIGVFNVKYDNKLHGHRRTEALFFELNYSGFDGAEGCRNLGIRHSLRLCISIENNNMPYY